MSWERFKAVEGTETVVIAGEVFKLRKSLKAKEVREIIAKYGNNAEAIQMELIRKIVIDPKPPENDEEFKQIWDEMDASIQAELIAKAMEISGLNKLFRLAMG
jgi:hypothetical protein